MRTFTVGHPARSSLWWANCTERGCTWRGRKRVSFADAEAEGLKHMRADHPAVKQLEDIWGYFQPAKLPTFAIEDLGQGVIRYTTPQGSVVLGADPGFTPKENTMRKRADIEAEAKQLERRLSALVDELARIDSMPKEPLGNGTVVEFNIRFAPEGKTYDYAAIRAEGKWFLTGREIGSFSWEGLLEFMSQDHRIQEGTSSIIFEVFKPGGGELIVQEIPK